MLVLDRFEGDFAIIENDDVMLEIEKSKISSEAVEGDILIEKNGVYYPDKTETAIRREKIIKLQNSLWG